MMRHTWASPACVYRKRCSPFPQTMYRQTETIGLKLKVHKEEVVEFALGTDIYTTKTKKNRTQKTHD